MPPEQTTPIKLFISYAHEDEPLRDQLTKHLASLERQGVIRRWYDREITAGAEWDREISEHLRRAEVILLLVSPDFIASSYCYDVEVEKALERHERGEAVVVPVIVRPVDWKGTPFQKLQALPEGAKPVTSWPNTDEAMFNVAQGIRRLVENLPRRGARRQEPPAMPQQEERAEPRLRWELVLSASFDTADRARVEAVVSHLRQLTGDMSITLMEVKTGSVRLILEGTAEAFETIEELFKSGRLIEVEGFKVESVRVVLDPETDAAPARHRQNQSRPTAKRATKMRFPRSVRLGVAPSDSSVAEEGVGATGVKELTVDEPEQPTENVPFPLRLLREAVRAVPAVKYALGVAGLAAAVSIVAGFQINLTVAVLGVVIMFILMTVLVIFSSFARSSAKALRPLALTLAWAFVCLTVATGFFIFTGFFFSWPRPLDQIAAQIIDEKTSTPTSTPEMRTLSYSILVCKYRTDPQCQRPFALAREMIFEEGHKIRLNISSPQPGYLYVINEGPATSGGLPEYVFLFPTPRVNGGSAKLDPNQTLTFPNDKWLLFDAEEGKEKLWLVWSSTADGDLEGAARNAFLRPEDQGEIKTPGEVVAVQRALTKYAAAPSAVRKVEDLDRTDVEGRGGAFAYAIVLEHH